MREIFFDEKLGETRRNSERVQAARAEMGVVGGVGIIEAVGLYCFDGFFKGDAMGDAAT